MRRREFITLLGGAAVAWPLAARGQQPERMRRIGMLMTIAADDPEAQPRFAAFRQELQRLGWTDGRDLRVDTRWFPGDVANARKNVAEMMSLVPEVILAAGNVAVAAALQASRSVPIVFVLVPDPVGQGFVDSLARPGDNATGFTLYEFGMGGKWLELLKQMAPGMTRAGVLRDATTTGGVGQFAAIQSVAPSLGVEIIPINVRDVGEIERGVASVARTGNDGLIVTGSGLAFVNREMIITLAAQHKLPAIYWDRALVTAGGLISYGTDLRDQFRQAAGYVDRILKGEKPGDLPVQAPIKYELVINLKTAKALGLDVPPTMLARADEVIE
jgi:putative tryptophan/tyrosine transport system substrate-binding protein